MADPMKVYRVWEPRDEAEPQLFEAAVVRETTRRYFIKPSDGSCGPDGVTTQVPKDQAYKTPAEAWNAYAATLRSKVAAMMREVTKNERNIAVAGRELLKVRTDPARSTEAFVRRSNRTRPISVHRVAGLATVPTADRERDLHDSIDHSGSGVLFDRPRFKC